MLLELKIGTLLIKFCCMVLDMNNEIYTHKSCIATTLNTIKNLYVPGTNFEEYWPIKVNNAQLLTNMEENTPPSIGLTQNTYQNKLTVDCMVNFKYLI